MHLDCVFEHRERASQALADRLAQVLQNAIDHRGSASLVVSGGSSPLGLFHALRRKPLDWSRITIIPSDERVVPPDHADSNEGMIRRELLVDKASAATLISLVGEEVDADLAVAQANAALSKLDQPIDVAVLGMGEDGHTASLFPDADDLDEALATTKKCIVQNISRLPSARISLSATALLGAGEIDLLFFGEKKFAVFNQAKQAGALAEFPVRVLLHQQRIPVTSYWAP